MNTRIAEKILKLMGHKGKKKDIYGCSHTAEEYKLAYQIMELAVEHASDSEIVDQVKKRAGLMDLPLCEYCHIEMVPSYSSNGVLDAWNCPNAERITGRHK